MYPSSLWGKIVNPKLKPETDGPYFRSSRGETGALRGDELDEELVGDSYN